MHHTRLRRFLAPLCLTFAAVFGLMVSACTTVKATPSDTLAVSPAKSEDTKAATGTSVASDANPSACRNPLFNPQCKSAEDEATCKKYGGEWQTCQGMMCSPGCLCPTFRGGCPCKSGADCEGGLCLTQDSAVPPAERRKSGICQRTEPMFGCLEILIAPGEDPVTLCID